MESHLVFWDYPVCWTGAKHGFYFFMVTYVIRCLGVLFLHVIFGYYYNTFNGYLQAT